jgi:hypothetical protein
LSKFIFASIFTRYISSIYCCFSNRTSVTILRGNNNSTLIIVINNNSTLIIVKALTEQLNQARELVLLFQSIITSCFADLARNVTTRQFTLYHVNCMHAWSTKSIGQNNSLVADQILIECQFKKLEAGVTNNLLSYHKERDHCTMHMCK